MTDTVTPMVEDMPMMMIITMTTTTTTKTITTEVVVGSRMTMVVTITLTTTTEEYRHDELVVNHDFHPVCRPFSNMGINKSV